MDADFLSRLVHPIYKERLQYDNLSGQLSDAVHKDKFSIKDNVPILLIKEEEAELTQTIRHADSGTTFHYKEHYQIDAATYDYFKETENKVEKEEQVRLHEYILSQIPGDTKWILDTGCGGGWLANALKHKNKKIISMDVADINPILATKNIPYPTHYGLVADVFELPIKEGSMDCIVASEIIEHVSDPKRFIASLFTALNPGGKLIITTPYNEQIRYSLCIHCNKLTPHNAHLHSFTETNIIKYLPENVTKYKTKVFNNKILVRTGIQRILRFMPLSLWKSIDSFCNALTNKRAYRLMLVVEK